MLHKIKQIASRNLVNIPGWRTDRKIVVFESDDWGSIRMPSKEVYKRLLENNIQVDHSMYDKYDILEQREDLEFLFEILSNFKDCKETHPIFTFNTVMGNPDFDRIEKGHFEKYYHEDFFKSYKVYYQDDLSFLWYNAIREKLIQPQFHAREHLNVSLWMDALQKNYGETRTAFNHRYFGLKTNTPSRIQKNYLAAYWAENEIDFKNKLDILKDGLEIFKQKFGFQSESFVACNFIYPKEMEQSLLEHGINYIQTQRGYLSPALFKEKNKIKRRFIGQINSLAQFYLVRNCFFEPSLDPYNNSINSCLNEIEAAFRWKKPAIISSHRINYVGGLSKKNRDNNLDQLNKLLYQILKKWPDVEFKSSDNVGRLMGKENENSYTSQKE